MALQGESAKVVQGHQETLDRVARQLVGELFGPDGMPWGTKFAELEDQAVELGQALARRIIAHTVSEQAAGAATLPQGLNCCPGCGGPVEAADPEGRVLTTRCGEVAWCEPQRTCAQCRRSFFPSVQESRD